jgi:hypothetical protein
LQVVYHYAILGRKFKEVLHVSDGLKTRKHYGVTIDLKLLDKFKELSESTRIPQSRLMDEAIKDLLEKFKGGK